MLHHSSQSQSQEKDSFSERKQDIVLTSPFTIGRLPSSNL